MHDAGDAERVAHDDGAPRHGGLVDRRHRAHAVADGRRLLSLQPDHEARTIHQIDHRQMEGLGEIDPAHHLLARLRRPRAAIVEGIAGHQQHRTAFEPGKPGDDRAAEIGAHLEEPALVHHGVDDRAHLVDLAPIARHRLQQQFLARAPDRRCTPRSAAGRRPRRQIGQETPRALERLLLGVDGMVDAAGAGLDLAAAEFLLGRGPGRGAPPPAGRRRTSPNSWSSPNNGWPRAAPRQGRRPSRGRAPPPARAPCSPS